MKYIFLLFMLISLSSFAGNGNNPPAPFTDDWCLKRPNNPHCENNGVPINEYLIVGLIIGICIGGRKLINIK